MINRILLLSGLAGLVSTGAVATAPASAEPSNPSYETFVPKGDRIDHRIDYSIWTDALRSFVISMGPPLRKMPPPTVNPIGTRRQIGHNSIYRLEGSMIGFSFMNDEVRDSFTEYREDLQRVADGLDIQSLPRNEQLAFWLNLHNVALVEQIAREWPIRQPREIEVDGVPLDDAKFIVIEGVALSPKDIRTKIVYPNWKDPRVIYGFWRGEIGGPSMRREAFEGPTVNRLLTEAAQEFIRSRRGTENRGKTLHVSRLYEEAAPFYFPDFESQLRAHLLGFSDEEVTERINKTQSIKATLREHDIADLAGGARSNAYFASGKLDAGVASLISQRQRKFDYLEREGIRTGSVTIEFRDIDLPGEASKKNEVE